MKSVILIAPPAAGKGTQSKLLCDLYNFEHISTGDLLRSELKKDSEIGKSIKEIMETGKLVNDEIIISLLINKLNFLVCNGYILDGFPRNLEQAIAYDKMLKNNGQSIDYVIHLVLSKEEAKKRIVGRISCPNCGSIYNDLIKDSNPLLTNFCDKCGTSLVKRDDDNEETFDVRFDTYVEETSPLINYYNNLGKLYEVDSSLGKMEIFNQITSIIGDQI
ncbi:MAG: adenylate kinase family protein [Bacilli bacterium]